MRVNGKVAERLVRIGVVADFVPFLLKAYNELGVVFDLFAHDKKRGMNTPLPQDLHQAFRVAARAVVKRQRHAAGLRRMAAREQDGQRGKQA